MRPARTTLKAIAFAGVAMTGAFFLIYQQRELHALRSKLAAESSDSYRSESGVRNETGSDRAKVRDRSLSSRASVEERATMIKEAGDLIEILSPSFQGKTFEEVTGDHRSGSLERLRDLFATMDGEIFSRLMEAHEDVPCAKSHMMFYHELFVRLNPEQALEQALAMPETDEKRIGEISVSFSSWCRANPTAAYSWYQEREQKGDPVAEMDVVGVSMIPLDAKMNPARAVRRVLELARRPGVRPNSYPLNTVYSAAETAQQRIALLAAFRSAAERPDAPPEAAMLRDTAIEEMTMRLSSEPFATAAPVVDSEFTAQEKLKFIAALVRNSNAGAAKLGGWAKWVATFDELPIDERHPLMKMVEGNRGGGVYAEEPVWIDDLPESPLKDQATVHYVNLEIGRGQPEMAVKWLKKVPAGEIRHDLISKLVGQWKLTDPSKAEAFLRSERPSEDAVGKH